MKVTVIGCGNAGLIHAAKLIEKGIERAKDFSWDKAADDIWNSLMKAIKE